MKLRAIETAKSNPYRVWGLTVAAVVELIVVVVAWIS